MGADFSNHQLKDWHVDSVVTYETESYELRKGTWCNGSKVTVFGAKKGQHISNGLEHSATFLRTLRHPCIVKHIQNCKTKGQFYLLTEEIIPLEILLTKQEISSIEVNAGLHDVLLALEFMHSKCHIRHNNLNTSSIFVSTDGNWKVGGFELAEKYDGSKNSEDVAKQEFIHSEDMHSFGDMALHLLNCHDLRNESIEKFMCRIKDECMHPEPGKRPDSTALLSDSFFRNDFLEIKSFLQHLILKTPEKRKEFFKSLGEKLGGLNPRVLVNHLLPLLLSRIVFLDPSAKRYFLPSLLKPKMGNENSSCALLTSELFKMHVIPKLTKILSVHDRHIRLLILEHFSNFAHLFPKDELKDHVLPEILLGIRDMSTEMVAASLRALAILVMLLGTQVVIGSRNQKMFTENIPNGDHRKKEVTAIRKQQQQPTTTEPQKNTEIRPSAQSDCKVALGSCEQTKPINSRPIPIPVINQLSSASSILERSSPDGGESLESDQWSDWEEEPVAVVISNTNTNLEKDSADLVPRNEDVAAAPGLTNCFKSCPAAEFNFEKPNQPHVKTPTGLGEEYDIMAINIQTVKKDEEEDYFADMEPKLVAPAEALKAPKIENANTPTKKPHSLFSILVEAEEETSTGWDDSELQVDW